MKKEAPDMTNKLESEKKKKSNRSRQEKENKALLCK